MKSGWQTSTLGEVLDVLRNGVNCQQDKSGNGDKISRIESISDASFDFEKVGYAELSERDKERYRLQSGDILFSHINSPIHVGKTAVFDGTEPVYHGVNLLLMRPKDVVSSAYLDHALKLLFQSGYWRSVCKQSVNQASVNQQDISRVEISYPKSLPEQQRIVGILDEAFDGIATAKAKAEQNLQNARALFESHLQSVFTQRSENLVVASDNSQRLSAKPKVMTDEDELQGEKVTKTGGRDATTRHIPGDLSLAVGLPNTGARQGWRWSLLTDLARLESGHTPSRKHPEYWGGSIPWIGIQDAREHHGQQINHTSQTTNELGIANSSARVLPKNTVCLSRTASVGYVAVMGRPMATSQDFVNWVCTDALLPDYLKYIFLAEGRNGLLRYASGSVHQTIYFPEAKAFCICHPDIEAQRKIVRQCDALREETQRLESLYQRKLAALDELKKSLLHQAFSGQL